MNVFLILERCATWRQIMWLMVVLVGFGAMGLGGCAVAPVAGDMAGETLGQSEALILRGKVESMQRATMDEVVAAVRKAAEELDVYQVREEKHEDQWKLVYVDQRKQTIVVTLVRRTPRTTEVLTDVGFGGAGGLGRLMMAQILRDLPEGKGATTQGKGTSAGK